MDGEEGKYYQEGRAPALTYLWAEAGVEQIHAGMGPATDCTTCHGAGVARPFEEYHNGYDPRISDSDGIRYADTYTATIDPISLAGNLLTIEFSASDPAITTEVLVSFYGWGSKHFIVPSHARDGSTDCI